MHNKGFCCDHDFRIGVAVFNGKLMKNWLRLICSLLVLGLAQGVSALGLGSITAESALNEPLEAQIELLNVGSLSEQEIIVQIGSVNDYQMAGVTREYFHTGIEFEPFLAGPNGRSYIQLSTTAPVREPYLNVVIQVRWPQGRLLREYTLLLDLPVFSGRTEASQVNQPSSASPAVTTPAPRPTLTSQPRQPTPVPPQQVFGGPTVSGTDYRVETGDTLWSLAGRVAEGQQMTRYQAMLAIRDLNPQAFVNGDPNTLRAGYLVRIPTEEQANTRSSAQAYNEFVSIQQGGSVGSLATPISAAATDFRNQSSAPASSGGRLALSSSSSLGSGTGSADEAEMVATLASENETLKEELDRSELENQDLQERVAMLEERLALSESLIEIENEELANVQQGLAQAEVEVEEVNEPAVEAESAPAPAPEPITPMQPAEPEPGLLAKIMSFAPFLGALIVIALLTVMFMMKRRKVSEDDDLLHDDYDDELAADTPVDDNSETDLQETGSFDETTVMSAEDSDEDEADSFESMDELFGSDDDQNEFDDEDEADPEDVSESVEPEEEPEPEDHSDDVEDIDLEAALEDLDDFADLDSFGDDEIEDFDLESEDVFEESSDEVPEPETSDEDEALDTDSNDMDFEAVDLPESEDDEDISEEEDDGNAMDFDLDDFDSGSEDEEADDEEPAGNEMEFDSSEIELPEADEADDDELDMGNATEFDTDIELPDVDDDDEPEEPAGNEMEFDLGEVDLPDADDQEDEDNAEDDGNLVDLDMSDIELPEEGDSSDQTVDEVDIELPSSDDELDLPDEDEDTSEDMDELLAGLHDEVDNVSDEEAESDSDEDLDLDLGADLDLDDDLLESLGGDDNEQSDLSEEMATKLELADAYIEMGDVKGAKELIDEIMSGGNDEQKAEAAKLSDRIEGLT